jgi:N-acetylglutamate synthase-like GNAT family acetyltransferase
MPGVALPEGYTISDDPALLDLDVVHAFIANESYWAKGIPKALVERTIANSLCWGVYFEGKQIGFARVISDKATFAYLCDVFIAAGHRGKGLSKALVATILAHPDLQNLRRWMLVTADAQKLYEQFGFRIVSQPERHMEIHQPGIYEKRDR